jgi:DNA-binding transcriptional ArsR family regulator
MPSYDDSHFTQSARLLKALGNSCRLHIIHELIEGEKNVSELNRSMDVSQPALSQHLSKLRQEGIVDCRRDQRQIYYYLKNPHAMRIVSAASEALHASYGQNDCAKSA